MLTSERKSDFSLFSQTKQQYAKRILLRSVSFSKDDPALSGNKLRPLTPLCLPWRDDMPNWYIPSEKIGQFLWPPKNVFIAIHLQHWTSGNELWQFLPPPPLGSQGGPGSPLLGISRKGHQNKTLFGIFLKTDKSDWAKTIFNLIVPFLRSFWVVTWLFCDNFFHGIQNGQK